MPEVDEMVGGIDVSAVQAGIGLAATVVGEEKYSRIFAGISTAIAVGEFAYKAYRSSKRRKQFTIKINENDKLFEVVQKWLMSSLPSDKQRSIVIESKRAASGYSDMDIAPVMSPKAAKREDFLKVYYDGEKRQEIRFGDDTVEIQMSSEQVRDRQGANSSKLSSMRSITIVCRSAKTRDAMLDMLTLESKDRFERKPSFWVARKWGNFRSESDVPTRPQDTVILREGQRERILKSLEVFLDNEERYVEFGLPWHMGLLLYGPPGTGKTSIATTIGHTLNLDIHYISLSSIDGDDTLMELLGEVSPRSILLLEDIDVAHASKSRDDSKPGVTLSGLLNGLDGIATPHGIITIMTTNHFESLDPALVRPGRVDVLEEIGFVTDEQARRLCERFIGFVPEDLPTVTEADEIVSSEIIDVFKSHLDDKEEAGRMLVKKFTSLVKEPSNVKTPKKGARKPADA